MALSTEYCSDFDPTSEGVHGYRMRTGKLELNDFSLLSNTDFFRFTVLRDPHTRLVSAYLDKLVKPVQCGAIGAARSDVLNLSFEDIVEWVYRVPDWAIEKHFRPQITFIRNVPLDHIGLLKTSTILSIFLERALVSIYRQRWPRKFVHPNEQGTRTSRLRTRAVMLEIRQ